MDVLRRFLVYTQHPRRWRWCFLPLTYFILLIPLFRDTFAHWGDAIATRCVERCDTGWQNVWSLWWVADALSQGRSPVHTDLLFYPGGVDLFWQTLMLANGILMLPITLAFGPIVAFNTLTLLTFVAAAWSAAILSETIVPHRFGAWVAGALYTYAPFHVWLAYSGFVERVSIQYFPIMLLALWHLTRSAHWRWVFVATVGVLGSFFSSLYYGLFSLTYVAVWALLQSIVLRQQYAQLKALWVRMVALALLVAAPVVPFAVSMLFPGKHPPSASDGAVALADYLERQVDFSASVLTFFTPSLVHPLWGNAVTTWYRQFSPTHWPVSLGFGVMLLTTVALCTARQRLPQWWWLLTGVVILFAMGPRLTWLTRDTGIPMPYEILNQIPLVKLGQRPNHFLFLALAHLVVTAAAGIAALAERVRHPQRWAVVLVMVLAFELWPLPLQPFAPTQSVVYDTIKAGAPGAVLTLPFDLDDGNTMYAQWYTQHPSVSGYLPRLNPELVNTGLLKQTDGVVQFTQPITTMTVLNRDPADALLMLMQRLDIPYLVVDHRFAVTTNPAVLAKLTPVVADDTLALFHAPKTSTPGVWATLSTGWFPIEYASDGRAWQWSEQHGVFWLYQRPGQVRDLIVHATFSVPAPMTVQLDGIDTTSPVTFVVDTPAQIRRYRILMHAHHAASTYWWHIAQLHSTSDRAVGIALGALSAEAIRP